MMRSSKADLYRQVLYRRSACSTRSFACLNMDVIRQDSIIGSCIATCRPAIIVS